MCALWKRKNIKVNVSLSNTPNTSEVETSTARSLLIFIFKLRCQINVRFLRARKNELRAQNLFDVGFIYTGIGNTS